jgi:LPXTG-motif cell wall-anchored protein
LPATGDKWISILKWVAIGCVALAVLLFVFYQMSLGSGVNELKSLAAGIGK